MLHIPSNDADCDALFLLVPAAECPVSAPSLSLHYDLRTLGDGNICGLTYVITFSTRIFVYYKTFLQ